MFKSGSRITTSWHTAFFTFLGDIDNILFAIGNIENVSLIEDGGSGFFKKASNFPNWRSSDCDFKPRAQLILWG